MDRPAERRSRGWLWYFLALVVLTAVAIGIEVWFNLQQQLTREQLDAARTLWREKGPRDYDLEYTKKGSASGTFVVHVRRGRVVSATMDGQPLEPRLYAYCDMDGLFDDVERLYDMDHAPDSPRVFATARFDPQDGHLTHYVRSVMSTRQRIEINARLQAVAEEPPASESGGR